MNKGFFITGIGTDVGKTFVSSLLCNANEWDYWKPVQCGSLENTDSDFIKVNLKSSRSKIHPEKFLLKEAASPHQAAKKENIQIQLSDFVLPESNRPILVEGAGGLLVPLNDEGILISDLIKHLNLPVILVVNFYLGSINHTLLSLDYLKASNLEIKCIVYNGPINFESKKIISTLFPKINTLEIPEIEQIHKLDDIFYNSLKIN